MLAFLSKHYIEDHWHFHPSEETALLLIEGQLTANKLVYFLKRLEALCGSASIVQSSEDRDDSGEWIIAGGNLHFFPLQRSGSCSFDHKEQRLLFFVRFQRLRVRVFVYVREQGLGFSRNASIPSEWLRSCQAIRCCFVRGAEKGCSRCG